VEHDARGSIYREELQELCQEHKEAKRVGLDPGHIIFERISTKNKNVLAKSCQNVRGIKGTGRQIYVIGLF